MMRLGLVLAGALIAIDTSADTPTVFSAASTAALTLQAPLDELFAAAAKDPDASVAGSITSAGAGGVPLRSAVHVSVRGNTSKNTSECTFPKLKLRFDDEPEAGSIFAGLTTLKIGTHCGESKGDALTRNGRLANERSPHREALVYRLLATLGIPTLEARPARIEYRDTSKGIADRPPITRDAFLLEEDDDAAKRMGGKRPIPEDEFTSADALLSREDGIAIAFGEALAGNFDWCLKYTPDDTYRCDARHPLWNVLAFERKDGPAAAFIYDFDTSGMVAGRHLWFEDVFNPEFAAGGGEPVVEVWSQLQRTRSLFGRAELDAARARFAARKAAAYAALDAADVDRAGARTIARYLDAFFAAMTNDDEFYLPVVVRPGTRLWADAAGSKEACPGGGPAPIGTPVGPPVDRRAAAVRVVVMDALWHWTGKNKCRAILNGPVWVDAKAISAEYPPP